MNTSSTTNQEQAKETLQVLDNLLAESTWDESTFYRAMGNKIRGMRDNFVQQMGLKNENTKLPSNMLNRVALRQDQCEVFIGLYCTNGTNLNTWGCILGNLPYQIIARPIYSSEDQVRTMIKEKGTLVTDAYVAVYIDQKAILEPPEGNAPIDKLGQKMLILKNNSINLENIHYFMHMFKKYKYVKGKLVAAQETSS